MYADSFVAEHEGIRVQTDDAILGALYPIQRVHSLSPRAKSGEAHAPLPPLTLRGMGVQVGVSVQDGGGFFTKESREGFHNPQRPFLFCIEDSNDKTNDISRNSYNSRMVWACS